VAEETEYSVVMELGDWFVIDATMDDELQVLAQAGRNFDDWGDETARDPYWAELDELARASAGWAGAAWRIRRATRRAFGGGRALRLSGGRRSV